MISYHSQANRRVAKNTLMLYIRMAITMGITFFTFRILLSQLGEVGYGTYNAVAGVIVLFSFLSSAMTLSTQRFLAFYLGKNNATMLNRVFCMSLNVQALICIILLVLAETIGLWFLNRYMNFPTETYSQVHMLYQLSVLTFLVQIMMVPFQAVIISHERMSFYAYLSILEVLLKISVVFILFLFDNNRIVVYSCCLLLTSIIMWSCYRIYCKHNFTICHYKFQPDKKLFRELTEFSGWNTLGAVGNIGASQGINMLFNIFCGVLVNAAMGIANQVSGAVSSFVTNFQTAFNPQIIKSYASGEDDYFESLIFRASRVSFFLIFIIGFPILLCCPYLLRIWLGEYPAYTVIFTRLIIVASMIDALSGPLWTAAQASGRIKTYMIVISSMIFSNVPVALLLLWLDCSPIWVIGYKVTMTLFIHFTRIGYLHRLIGFPFMRYMCQVMLKVVAFLIFVLPLPLWMVIHSDDAAWSWLSMSVAVCCTLILGYGILLDKDERHFLFNIIKSGITN